MTRARRNILLALSSVVVVGGAVVGTMALMACGATRPRPTGNPVLPNNAFKMPERPVCTGTIRAPVAEAALGEEALVEVSGVVASARQPGILWMHNDSGDDARVFAVTTGGVALGELALPDVEAVDFEDIATGPCPDLILPCLYIGDTGDNREERANAVIYAFPEPEVSVEKPLAEGANAETIWRFPVTWAGGPANIEGFVVLPDASAMVFFEKTREDARVFRYAAPWRIDTETEVNISGTMTPPGPALGPLAVITGADIHPSGTRLLLRLYTGVYEAVLDPTRVDGKRADTVDAEDFSQLYGNPDEEPQGEAVAYDEAGTGIWTVSESPDRIPGQPLHHATCE